VVDNLTHYGEAHEKVKNNEQENKRFFGGDDNQSHFF
jgi:hypothetical protein